ncbi:MAG: response regulator [Lachnospiraceae bacterium]|nr:response regulator [Lachnospiraceae bacterium]
MGNDYRDREVTRTAHLLILISYSVFTAMLVGESFLLGWETWTAPLLIIGVLGCWGIHFLQKFSDDHRLWIYAILMMATFFFYGIHETSMYDTAPVMCLVIMIYSVTSKRGLLHLCLISYFVTMSYDIAAKIFGGAKWDSLDVTRTLLHLALVFMAWKMADTIIKKEQDDELNFANRIAVLEDTNRRTEDFLTNVSHELRTPINAVTGITSVMLKKAVSSDVHNDILSVQRAGRRLFEQIGDILDYTEIDTKRIRVSEERYILSSVINDLITEYRVIDSHRNIELIFDVDTTIPKELIGDSGKIKKILRHLIGNASKFTKEGGAYIHIFKLNKPYGINLCMEISDTGIGMDEKEMSHIKEKFYQADSSRSRRQGGLGLGLSIVYGLTRTMGGFMHIDSAKGKGSVIYVSIPQKVGDSEPQIVLKNRENLSLACFLKLDKYSVPKVRDYYNNLIGNMVTELNIPLHRTDRLEDLEKILKAYHISHIFTAKEEYEENAAFFDKKLDKDIELIVFAEGDYMAHEGSRARVVQKPFYALAIANVLNSEVSDDNTDGLQEKQMKCPGVKALVVDDESMNLLVAEGIFSDYGMTVKTALSGAEAIELCEKDTFDIIFMDHMMPEMDGVETMKRLRQLKDVGAERLTVVALTANAVSGAKEMFINEGFDGFVAKPIESVELERVLRNVLPKSAIEYEDMSGRSNIVDMGLSEALETLAGKGINVSAGLQYCRGDSDFYTELLKKFAREAEFKLNEIKTSFENKDYDNYRIKVHALKSTSKMIGADELSELARNLENAAKQKDALFINTHEDSLIASYEEVGILLKSAFPEEAAGSGEMQSIEKGELTDKLKQIKSSLDTFEEERAQALLKELSTFTYKDAPLKDSLAAIKMAVDDFEMTQAGELVDKLRTEIENDEWKGGSEA